MKLNPLFFPIFLLFLTCCSTDIQLEGPGNPVPVVYGIINAADTAHYIRIEKVFQTQGGNAERLAQDPQFIYYAEDEMSVFIAKENEMEIPLKRVDGAREGFAREEGPFATAPNILYKIDTRDFRLDGGEKITLKLDFSESHSTAMAETTVLEPVSISNVSPPSSVNMGYDRVIRTSWSSGEAAALHLLRWIIRYRERQVPEDWEEKVLVWTLSDRIDDTPGASLETMTFRGREFYEFLAAQLIEAPGIQREWLGIEIEVVSMGAEFEEILRLNNAATGITSAQFDPIYSNVTGGIGVFTSRSGAHRKGISLSPVSLDSLRNGSITRGLNF